MYHTSDLPSNVVFLYLSILQSFKCRSLEELHIKICSSCCFVSGILSAALYSVLSIRTYSLLSKKILYTTLRMSLNVRKVTLKQGAPLIVRTFYCECSSLNLDCRTCIDCVFAKPIPSVNK
jgi:hypothetical protein